MNKKLSDYVDRFGMIVTKFDRDGGDSCAHGCAILYASLLTHRPMLDCNVYTIRLQKDDTYCRHPDKTKWYSRSNTLSRDQFTSMLILLGQMEDKDQLRRLFHAHLKHCLLFAWNTTGVDTDGKDWKVPDLTFIDILGLWIRAFRCHILYPLLFLFDTPALIGSILYRFKFVASTIQMNHVLIVDFSNRVMPTFISRLTMWIYGKKTPTDALTTSWGSEWQPPVNTYLIPLIESWNI